MVLSSKHKTAYEVRISDWSSDVCSSDLCLDQLSGLADSIALDHLGDLGSDHVGAEQFADLRIEHRLHETLDLAQGNRLAVADEGEVADLDRVPRLLRLLLGQPEAGDLREIGRESCRERVVQSVYIAWEA